MIKRDKLLNEIIDRKHNHLVKIISGIRRCGKSYILNKLFYDHLLENNVKKENIIRFAFDFDEDLDKLDKYYPEENTKIYEKNKKL